MHQVRFNIKFLILVLVLIQTACAKTQTTKNGGSAMEKHPYTNHLVNESSPYLLQHAHNPVNWYPWGQEALDKAKAENKMLIISVGYAACHWCHVMEHQSFEDTAVANLMNQYFVAIKVDREERPDVDQIYMNAAQLINGSGGWPLNAFALPNGKPFFAGTYFPKDNWIKVLEYFADVQQKQPELLAEQADKVTQGIHTIENVPLLKEPVEYSMQEMDLIFENWKPSIDFVKGGGNRAPKFPMPNNWEYLLHYSTLTQNAEALQAVTTTLDNMAMGGIYDQIGGGFARYSTDADWHVPHFEKMLYDNAQLVSLYSHAWQQAQKPLYRSVVYETLEFMEREMTSPEGGFYASLDADSEGEEGKFYVWTKAEIEELLGKDARLFMDYYHISERGNWEHGKNILLRRQTHHEFAAKHATTVEELDKTLAHAKATLLKSRSGRVRPGLDDKILTSWNALMITGYVDAYKAFGEKSFLDKALKNARFLLENTVDVKNGILRNYKNGKATIHAFLDDYAFVIASFIDLYEATFDEAWLQRANGLALYTLTHFFDASSGMFFYTDNNYADLISRKMEVSDNVIPASNSEMAKNLFLLGQYLYNTDFIEKSGQMLANVKKDVHEHINYYSNWGIVELYNTAPFYEVAVVGDKVQAFRKEMSRHYLPNALLLGSKKEETLELLKGKYVEGQTTLYVCHDKTCNLPVTSVSEALEQMR